MQVFAVTEKVLQVELFQAGRITWKFFLSLCVKFGYRERITGLPCCCEVIRVCEWVNKTESSCYFTAIVSKVKVYSNFPQHQVCQQFELHILPNFKSYQHKLQCWDQDRFFIRYHLSSVLARSMPTWLIELVTQLPGNAQLPNACHVKQHDRYFREGGWTVVTSIIYRKTSFR